MQTSNKKRKVNQEFTAIHHSYMTINNISILTPRNTSHIEGLQSSPNHMEALQRSSQARQRRL